MARRVPRIGADGTIYFETGDGAYNPATGELATTVMGFTSAKDTLTLKDYYTPTNHEWADHSRPGHERDARRISL